MWFVINETRLVYHPTRSLAQPTMINPFKYERVEFETPDRVKLVGWVVRAPAGDSLGTWILYLHGNYGNIAESADRIQELLLLGVNVFAADYRGFGESEGRPEEHGLYLDAETMFEYMTNVLRVPPHRIVLYGYSLGSGVAIELAGRRESAALIVEGAYKSIPERTQELYPYIPVSLLAQNRFDSFSKIPALTLPKLFIHAVDDSLVPSSHGQALFDRAIEPKTFLAIHGGHNDDVFVDSDAYLAGVGLFLTSQHLLPARQKPLLRTGE
jgi:fermentation-respiration switch protein FrsA (DUF1100 family)